MRPSNPTAAQIYSANYHYQFGLCTNVGAFAISLVIKGSSETRHIRLVGIRLADFGITPANVGSVTALKVTPGGNSDYAFIGYNANAIFLAPNVTPNEGNVTTEVCSGSARLDVDIGYAGKWRGFNLSHH